MSTAYADLARTCELIARRRPAWVNDPSLEPFSRQADPGVGDIEAVIKAVRGYSDDIGRSDQAVLALVAVANREPDALTVLVHALAPILRARLSRSVTEEYRTDALADLVFVLCDAIERGELALQSNLALRLVNRAHNRAHKRNLRTCATPWPPDWIGVSADDGSSRRPLDVADLAVARVDLAGFMRAVKQAVENGLVSSAAWATYRDHRLVSPLVLRASRSSASQRAIAARTARRLQPLIDIHLAGHAA